MTPRPKAYLPLTLLMNLSLIGATAAGNAAGEPELRTFHAQPCFVLATKEVELAITRTGGIVVLDAALRLRD